MNAIELLLHPVRLRIMAILSGGPELTTTQLCTRLDEVSKVTVYRQIALLVEGGCLEVAGEHRVRGAVERRYRLRAERPRIDAGMAAEMTLEDHRRGFAAAISVLVAEFNAYLDRADTDPAADGVGYRQGILWLSPEELAALGSAIQDALHDVISNVPAPGRIPYVLSPIMFPRASRPGNAADPDVNA